MRTCSNAVAPAWSRRVTCKALQYVCVAAVASLELHAGLSRRPTCAKGETRDETPPSSSCSANVHAIRSSCMLARGLSSTPFHLISSGQHIHSSFTSCLFAAPASLAGVGRPAQSPAACRRPSWRPAAARPAAALPSPDSALPARSTARQRTNATLRSSCLYNLPLRTESVHFAGIKTIVSVDDCHALRSHRCNVTGKY